MWFILFVIIIYLDPFKFVKNYYRLYDADSKGFIGFDNKGYTYNRIYRDFLIGHIVNTDYSNQSFDFLGYGSTPTSQFIGNYDQSKIFIQSVIRL